jgi:hypothetical protein
LPDVTSPVPVRRTGTIVVALIVLSTATALCTGVGGPPKVGPQPVASGSAARAAPSAQPPHEHFEVHAPAPADALALLDGLGAGTVMDGWPVESVAVRTKEIVVSFGANDSGFEVHVGVRGGTKVLAPFETEKFAVSFGFVREYGGPVPREVPGKIAAEVAARIRRTETTVPLPQGL